MVMNFSLVRTIQHTKLGGAPSNEICWNGSCGHNPMVLVEFREWATNMKRDTLASHVGHHSRLNYFSVI